MIGNEHCCDVGCCDSCQQPTDLSLKQPSKKLKPIPPPLDLAGPPTLTLKEFAIIATSPKSPLMQKNLPFRKRAYSFPSNEETTTPPATPPQLPPPPPPPPQPSPPVAASCSALLSPAPSSIGSSREDLCPWPFPVWHCFQHGSMIKLPGETGWHRAEDLATAGFLCDWLQFEKFENLRNGSMKVIFNGYQGKFEAHCLTLNTFYTQEKGWCAICPNEVARNYGFLCPPLESGDVCLQPCSTITPDICENLRRFSFPPDESVSPKPKAPADKAKRPMNAFMLFAKRYRLELIQMHPGKDNRAISVLLGEAWRCMSHTEKQVYVAEARALAQEQKRRHPDCWKRKRSLSTS